MKKPISPAVHGIVDYALVGSLLTLPAIFGFSKTVRILYAAEATALLAYIALTDTPVAIKPLIPLKIHKKIDPFNVANFALHSLLKPFRTDKRAQLFNAIFTVLAGSVVALTNWNGPTKLHPEEELVG